MSVEARVGARAYLVREAVEIVELREETGKATIARVRSVRSGTAYPQWFSVDRDLRETASATIHDPRPPRRPRGHACADVEEIE